MDKGNTHDFMRDEIERVAQFDQAKAAYKDHAVLSSTYYKELRENGLSWFEAAAVIGFWLAGIGLSANRDTD